MAWLKDLEERLAKALKHQSSIDERLKQLRAESDSAHQKVVSLQTLLRIEREEQGQTDSAPDSPAGTVGPPVETVAQFIREVVRQASARGVTPSLVRKRMGQANIQAHDNYAYSVLAKMKERGEVIHDSESGRYIYQEAGG